MACQNMGSGLSFEPWGTDFYYMGTPDTSEDCLYLNVFTGAREPGEKRPVYMWFHGGGLSHGSRGSFYRTPEDDVASVSAGYRLLVNGKATPTDCVSDAAAVVAWTLKHMSVG